MIEQNPMAAPEWLHEMIPAANRGENYSRALVMSCMVKAVQRYEAERPPLTLRPMYEAPRDGTFILIQHNMNRLDDSPNAEITFSLCYWDDGWRYTRTGKRMFTLPGQDAHGWIPRPVLPE
jgi:hypothetical protein